jgi:hypothetical protein
MGLFDLFQRKPTCPADLREAFIETAAQRDWQSLAAVCQRHRDEIRKSFPLWIQVPEPIRDDPIATDRYCQTLIAVAQLLEQAGDQSLMALLLRDEADNPLTVWRQDLLAAQTLINNGQSREAVELLQSVLAKTAAPEQVPPATTLARVAWQWGVAPLAWIKCRQLR